MARLGRLSVQSSAVSPRRSLSRLRVFRYRPSDPYYKSALILYHYQVLVISLFGPRQGRILYARFNIDGTLIVRASDIFDFEKKKNQEGFDLMRCYNCEPEDVAEFGSIAPVKKARSPTIAVGRTSQ